MIKAKFYLDNNWINIEEYQFINVVIENKGLYRKYMQYLYDGFVSDEDYWFFKDGEKVISVDNVSDFIPSFFNIDINSKKNLNALYKLLRKFYFDQYRLEIGEINKLANNIVSNISIDFDIPLYFNGEVTDEDIFKLFEIKFNCDVSNLRERIVKYIDVVYELRGIRVFFVANLLEIFDQKEVIDIINEIKYKNIVLINLENKEISTVIENKLVLIIDQELCLIK